MYVCLYTRMYAHTHTYRSPELVKLSAEKGFDVLVGDNMRLPYRSDSFDAAVGAMCMYMCVYRCMDLCMYTYMHRSDSFDAAVGAMCIRMYGCIHKYVSN